MQGTWPLGTPNRTNNHCSLTNQTDIRMRHSRLSTSSFKSPFIDSFRAARIVPLVPVSLPLFIPVECSAHHCISWIIEPQRVSGLLLVASLFLKIGQVLSKYEGNGSGLMLWTLASAEDGGSPKNFVNCCSIGLVEREGGIWNRGAMGRPKRGTVVRKPLVRLVKKNANVAVQVESKPAEAVEKEVEEEVGDLEEQLRVVNIVCNAVDQEVESRSAAIVAIGDGHAASATTLVQAMMSKFPEHIRKMPMKEFLKQHCPNTVANTHPNATLNFDLVQPAGGDILNFDSGFATVQNTPGFALSQTMNEQIGENFSDQLAR